MGISEGSRGDCSVGAIVWVRRRNGSWWPGRILGPHELSASHLMSPRSGTPVKLLGREDASVDWYNLEKSKRVKAFRCGEFDDYIERAESSQGLPIKKREKYARREDAILHALELERQHLESKRQKLGIGPNCIRNKMSSNSSKEFGNYSQSESFLGNHETRDHFGYMKSKSQTLDRRQDLSLEGESMTNTSYVQNRKHAKSNWEDDNAEAIPRMRGLQDLGLKAAPSKRKPSISSSCRSSQRPPSVENHLYALQGVGRNAGILNNGDCVKDSVSIKRKRSQGGLTEESLVRRRDRRRPLVHVLQNSAKLQACEPLQPDADAKYVNITGGKDQLDVLCQAKTSKCVYLPDESNNDLENMRFPLDQMPTSPTHFGTDNSLAHPGSLTEDYTSSGLMDVQESTSSEGDYLNPEMDEEEGPPSDPVKLETYTTNGGSVDQNQLHAKNMDNVEPDDIELSNYAPDFHPDEQTAVAASDVGSSQWQLKGKRNIRNLIKRPMEILDGKGSAVIDDKCNVVFNESLHEVKGNVINPTRMNSQSELIQKGMHHRGEELGYTQDDGDLDDNGLGRPGMVGFGSRRYLPMSKAFIRDRGRNGNSVVSSDEDSHIVSPSIWEADRLSQAAFKGYWEESDGCFDSFYVNYYGDRINSMLVDVDLKVQASYQGERVPLVSLMSRLNGKAIVGHPVQIETLEDGCSDALLSRDDYCDELSDPNGNTALPPVWHTARRTAMHRIPRPPPSAAEGEEANALQYSDLDRECTFKKSYASNAKNKVKLMHEGFPPYRQPLAQKKFPKKLLKKVSLCSQKTRTLSSIVVEPKLDLADKDAKLPELIKPETTPIVTCVPIKLVFSRIREAIGRPPSAAANHGILTAGNTVLEAM